MNFSRRALLVLLTSLFAFDIYADVYANEVRVFFQKVLIERLDGFYIANYSAIEKIALKPLFNPAAKDWISALSSVDFADSAHILFPDAAEYSLLPDAATLAGETQGVGGECFLDGRGDLRLFSYSDEYFSVFGNTAQSENKDCVFRTEYDDYMRVARKIKWDISKSQKSPEMLSMTAFYYANENDEMPQSTEERFFTETDKKKVTEYDVQSGLPIRISITEGGAKSAEYAYKYDDLSRLRSESVTKYEGEKQEVSKKEYIYTTRSEEPDIKIYENGKLRLITEYTDENIYTITTYFDDNYAISAYYVHGRKEIETVYLNNKVVRRRRF